MHYTHGEKFFPMDVEPYVRASSLWLHVPEGTDEEVVPEGQLTLDRLVERREAPFGSLFYLRFVHPLDLTESASALAGERRLEREQGSEFKAGIGRLARGGLLPRLGDGLFSLSLLLRGTVPGATAAAAALKYDEIRKNDGRFVYQGRVVRQSGWTVCQYWFFFAYNPWRSGFHGVNDHESDWEMISVYLYEDGKELVPGLGRLRLARLPRRRPPPPLGRPDDLELVDGHPVVYAGAGSHASYFRPGEYQAEVPIPAPRRIKRLAEALDGFWRIRLGQGDETRRPLRIPFVDFARGDGLSIGAGQQHEWTPNVIDESTPWASEYRGLWGLFARDPISGENAPAGPMYDRDGSGRPSWFDPLGFAGLAQVTPPPQELGVMETELRSLERRQAEIEGLVVAETRVIRELGVRLESMRGSPHLAAESTRIDLQAASQTERLTALRRESSENGAVIEGLERSIERSKAGDAEDGRAHIRHAAAPVAAAEMRFNHAAEVWAAISISALLIGLAVLIIASPSNVWAETVVLIIAFVIGESVLRGTFVRTINRVGVILALIAFVVLFLEYLRYMVAGLLIALATFLLYQRIRELRA